MSAVVDEDGVYLGDMPTERSQFIAHTIRVLTIDTAARFEVLNHFKMLEGVVDVSEELTTPTVVDTIPEGTTTPQVAASEEA